MKTDKVPRARSLRFTCWNYCMVELSIMPNAFPAHANGNPSIPCKHTAPSLGSRNSIIQTQNNFRLGVLVSTTHINNMAFNHEQIVNFYAHIKGKIRKLKNLILSTEFARRNGVVLRCQPRAEKIILVAERISTSAQQQIADNQMKSDSDDPAVLWLNVDP